MSVTVEQGVAVLDGVEHSINSSADEVEEWGSYEKGRIDAFELWYWKRLLRVPWTARRSNQPILKEISPEYSMEGLMLKLKLQYFVHPDAKAD